MKKFIIALIILLIFAAGLFFISRKTASEDRKIEWGITFSKIFAEKIDPDWKKMYLEILDELEIKNIRLAAYWSEIEDEAGKYEFADLDWQINEASKRNAKIILAVGKKLPRWPECHQPKWVNSQTPAIKEKLLGYMTAIIDRYKDNPAIVAWQVENEPFLAFGECSELDEFLLDEEIALVRSLDSRPIVMTDSGELSLWVAAARRGDIFGTTMYRWVWHDWLGSWKYPIPPAFFRAKERLARFFVGKEKEFIVIELQGEPWFKLQIYETPLEKQLELLSFDEFKSLVSYAKETGFSTYYLWGAEWWWSLKQKGHPEYMEYVRNLNNNSL